MRYLRLGSRGDDVLKWEHFLKGRCAPDLLVDGVFTEQTVEATKTFQRLAGFFGNDIDGVVGNNTLSRAAAFGFQLAIDDSNDESGPSWPKAPSDLVRPSYAQRTKLFGTFSYTHDPIKGNLERIKISGDWVQKNVVSVNIPQLKNVAYAPTSCNVDFHRVVAKQLQSLFSSWEKAGLSDRIISWGGSYSPRFIRGSTKTLSNHAWATAFDINVAWNMLGSTPALKGQHGSVRELVTLAYENGFAWGGHFDNTRIDGMHFEIYRII